MLAALFVSSHARADAFDIFYNGRLRESPTAKPVDGPVDLELHFYAGGSTAVELVPAKIVADVPLSEGVFAVRLPLTAGERATVFESAEVWIGVKDSTHNKAYPRQLFSGVPYALRVPVDQSTLGYDGNGQLFVKGAAPTATFTQANNQYVATDVIKARDSGGLKVSNASGAGMVVDDSGNIGIGTTGPTTKFHTFGSGTISLLAESTTSTANAGLVVTNGDRKWSAAVRGDLSDYFAISDETAGQYRLVIDNAGKVGIGTTSPNNLLQVAGLVSFDDNAEGTFIGHNAGTANTVSGNNGKYNTFAGYSAGQANTSGWINTAVGHNALRDNTTGRQNTAFGAGAHAANVTGSNNVVLGDNALNVSTASDANTAVGSGALNADTTGYRNVAVGNYSMHNNTTGFFNVAVGEESLTSNVTGNTNTAVGAYAGHDDLTGTGNVFLGYRAGYAETGSNKLYIANSSATPPLIYGDFSAGSVGIGSATPQATLDVNGYARLAKFTTAPVACDAAHDGSIALSSANYLCLCINGTGWRRASDGTTACSTW